MDSSSSETGGRAVLGELLLVMMLLVSASLAVDEKEKKGEKERRVWRMGRDL